MNAISRLLSTGALTLLLIVAACAQATTRDCGGKLVDVTRTHPSATTVLEMQRQLVTLGFPVSPIDGKLGPDTRAALTLFCEDARFAVGEALTETLRTHALLREAHPCWEQTLASAAFAEWSTAQSDQAEIARITESGRYEEVVMVIQRFEQHVDRYAPLPSPAEPDDVLYSFSLNKADLEQLRSRQQFADLLAGLAEHTYPSKQELERVLAELLKELPGAETYARIATEEATATDAWFLTQDSMNSLRVAGIPAPLVQAFAELQNLPYAEANGGSLDAAVDSVASRLTADLKLYRSQILALVPDECFRLTETALSGFVPPPGDPLGGPTQKELLRLAQLKTEYCDRASFAVALDRSLHPIAEQIPRAAALAKQARIKTRAYRLDAGALTRIAARNEAKVVDPKFIDALAEVEGIDFPDQKLFWAATRVKYLQHEASTAVITDASSASVMERALLAEEGAEGGTHPFAEKALAEYRPTIIAQATKAHPIEPTVPVSWRDNACGCVHPDLRGEVYGIYPFWMAGGPQVVDFSILSRVGFYGISFNDNGEFVAPNAWEQQKDLAFIQEARRHGTRLDLVVYRNQWDDWRKLTAVAKTKALKRLAKSISEELSRPLEVPSARVTSYVSLGMSRTAGVADGVTLHFDGYPEEDADAFFCLLQELAKRREEAEAEWSINILLRDEEVGKGIHEYRRMHDVVAVLRGPEHQYAGTYLILLREPTTYHKKLLRVKVESALHGAARMELLRNITMVLSYDAHQSLQQLRDDVIYAYDNFGGVGFWPLPLADKPEKTAAWNVLHKDFRQHADQVDVCRFVCPNRWAFHLALDLLLFGMLAATLLFALNCSWRSWLQDHFVHLVFLIVTPFVLTGLALLFCDPQWDDLAKGNSLLILLVAGVIAYALWNYRRQKQRATLP